MDFRRNFYNSKFSIDKIIGYEETKDKIKILASFEVDILFLGETGTGKEMFAYALHNLGPRKRNRFVHLNCSTIPSSLLEAELFGYKKGTFTDAKEDRTGKIEYADKGTLFLDEMGNISLEAQAKILRVIEYKDLYRLGENIRRPIDVRYVFATNIDLDRAVMENNFREDLFYRINAHTIKIPPLRTQKKYIPMIIDYYWKEWDKQTKRPLGCLSRDEIEMLMNYDYPGNIRELIGLIERIFINSIGSNENKRHEYIKMEMNNKRRHAYFVPLKEKIMEYARDVAHKTNNLSETARILEIDRKTLRKYLKGDS